MGIGADLGRELKILADTSVDVIFNLCESLCGESRLQPCFAGYLELLGIPFTGAPAEAITLAIDKLKTKALLSAAGIPTPEYYHVDQILPEGAGADEEEAGEAGVAAGEAGAAAGTGATPRSERTEAELPPPSSFPLIVKPAQEDGSIGIEQSSVAENRSQLISLLKKSTGRFGRHILVERYIAGREISVGLLGNDCIEVLPLVEATFAAQPAGYRPIITYQVKWEPESGEHQRFRRICPAPLAPDLAKYIEVICRKAYQLIGLSGYGRIDIRLETDTSRPYIIDVNANPDLTGYGYGSSLDNSATLPLAAQVAGITYPELIDRIIKCALLRRTKSAMPWGAESALQQSAASTAQA